MKTALKASLRHGRNLGILAGTSALRAVGRPPRFSGAYPTRTAALTALSPHEVRGYDDPSLADVSFPQMCRRETWDYPVVHWLERLLPSGGRVLDAGGHMGTKYIAFSDLLDLGRTTWTVYDTPGIVTAARQHQAAGRVPEGVAFVDRLTDLPETDVLLASGLLQYLDVPLADVIAALPARPKHIILNKVALRHGPTIFTLERLGAVRVPYQMRSHEVWQDEVSSLGYDILDNWQIRELTHTIPTQPWLPASESWGFVLSTRECAT